jgi:ABC-type transport system involved in cytochrome c biogenesis ATPase subunit
LRLIAGLDRPTAGTVRLGERVVTDVDPRCAVVFQEPRLFPWRTVAANVALGARRTSNGASPAAMLERVGLAGFDRVFPHQLSGGMAQRAALARALIGRPEVLLLDEPFASLDALTRLRMQDLLVEACREPRPTVVMVTHDVGRGAAAGGPDRPARGEAGVGGGGDRRCRGRQRPGHASGTRRRSPGCGPRSWGTSGCRRRRPGWRRRSPSRRWAGVGCLTEGARLCAPTPRWTALDPDGDDRCERGDASTSPRRVR